VLTRPADPLVSQRLVAFRRMRVPLGSTPPYEILDDFKPSTEFHHVVDLYVFDKRLGLRVLDDIERVRAFPEEPKLALLPNIGIYW
jgi:hypothetical protein